MQGTWLGDGRVDFARRAVRFLLPIVLRGGTTVPHEVAGKIAYILASKTSYSHHICQALQLQLDILHLTCLGFKSTRKNIIINLDRIVLTNSPHGTRLIEQNIQALLDIHFAYET
jgi:hypothetical protein